MFCYDHGIPATCHAGEAYGPESIKAAVKDCHVRRIGHGTQLFRGASITSKKNVKGECLSEAERAKYISDVAEWIADNRITLEVCLKSNSQTLPDLRDLSQHPIVHFLEQKLRIVLGTDNRAISRVSVTDEYERAIGLYNHTEKQLKNMTVGGFKSAFYPGSYLQKRNYISKVIEFYDSQMAALKIS